MVARPTKALAWATDANFTNGGAGIAGTPTTVEPSAGVKAEGDVPGTPYPAQRGNWWKNIAGSWQAWFAAIIDSSEEHTYQAFKTRGFEIAPNPVGFGSGWTWNGSGGVWTSTHGDAIPLKFAEDLRSGQSLINLTINVTQGHTNATNTNRMALRVYSRSGATNTLIAGPFYAPNTAGLTAITSGILAIVIDRSQSYFLTITSSTTAGDGGLQDVVESVDITNTDYGPRNAL